MVVSDHPHADSSVGHAVVGGTPKETIGDRLFIAILALVAAALLLAASYLRHWHLQSGLYDLGIFDQAVYLISQGLPPIVTTQGFAILGDHAAYLLYPVALLYRLIPSINWLFIVQAVSLAAGVFPLYAIARDRGVSVWWARAIAVSYLLYPQVFNANLYDFHPEVMAVPALFWAVLAARRQRPIQLAIAIVLILGCKAVLSFTVVMMGALFFLERRRIMGVITAAVGLAWYCVSAYLIIPAFSANQPAALGRYSAFGDSLTDVARNILFNPQLVWSVLAEHQGLFYCYLLVIPVAIGLHWKTIGAFLPALPTIALNLLSSNPSMRTFSFQYALPIIPFLMIWLADSIPHAKRGIVRRWMLPIFLVASSAWGFNTLSLRDYHPSDSFPNETTLRKALGMITGSGGVLTECYLAPQVGHRPVLAMLRETTSMADLDNLAIDYVLLNTKAPAWGNSAEFSQKVIERLTNDHRFERALQEEGVILFIRKTAS